MKPISIVLIFLFISASALAQEEDSSKGDLFKNWHYGAKAGLNLSNMYGDVGNNSFIPYIHFGLVADHKINELLTLSLEPHLSGEGQKLGSGFDKIIYFNIPILVKWQVADQVTVDGGLKAGVKVAEKTKFSNGETSNRNRFKRIAPGITLGSTYKINQKWFAQFRVNVKFSDVVRDDAGDSEGSTIRLFQLSVGRFLDR